MRKCISSSGGGGYMKTAAVSLPASSLPLHLSSYRPSTTRHTGQNKQPICFVFVRLYNTHVFHLPPADLICVSTICLFFDPSNQCVCQPVFHLSISSHFLSLPAGSLQQRELQQAVPQQHFAPRGLLWGGG